MSSLADLRTAVRRYINEEDATNSHFTDSEINDYLNQAVTFLGTQMEWAEQTDQAAISAGQTLYQLPDDFIALVDVYFDNKKLVILERADLSSITPQWQDSVEGIPRCAYRAGPNIVGLYPTPDMTQDGLLLQIQYIQIPATLVNDSDIPGLHTSFQMCLPFYAAFLCDYKLGNDKKSDMHLQKYDEHRKALMSKVQKFSDDLMRFRWDSGNRPINNWRSY
jgi:hypothetical protein